MHYRLLYPSKYVGAWDLNGDTEVTIEKVIEGEELVCEGGKKDYKPILVLKGATKKFVLGKTNAKSVGKVLGNDTSDWPGKKITLYPTTCSGKGGEIVECIRVREK